MSAFRWMLLLAGLSWGIVVWVPMGNGGWYRVDQGNVCTIEPIGPVQPPAATAPRIPRLVLHRVR